MDVKYGVLRRLLKPPETASSNSTLSAMGSFHKGPRRATGIEFSLLNTDA